MDVESSNVAQQIADSAVPDIENAVQITHASTPNTTLTCCEKAQWNLNRFNNKVAACTDLTYKLSTGYVNDHIAACTGRKISSEDISSIMLLALGVLESLFSPRKWPSVQFKIGFSALVSILTFLNDRKNFNEKSKQLTELQLDFIKYMQCCPDLIASILVYTKKDTAVINLTVDQYANFIEFWDRCSKIEINLTSDDVIILHNFKSANCMYAKIHNYAIVLSVFFLFLNVFVFDLLGLLFKSSDFAHGTISSVSLGFSADVELDFARSNQQTGISGVYFLHGFCNSTTDAFAGSARILPNSAAQNLHALFDNIAKVLGGIPYRGIASWYTVYKTHQLTSIRDISVHVLQTLTDQFADMQLRGLAAIKIPRELVYVLSGIAHPEQVIDAAKLKADVGLYNKEVLAKAVKEYARRDAIDKISERVRQKLKHSLSNPALPGNTHAECDQLVDGVVDELTNNNLPRNDL